MTVIGIIIGLILMGLLYALVEKFEVKMNSKFQHSFFSWESFAAITVANWMIFFGNNWHESAIAHHTDTLNGIVLMVLALIIYLSWIAYNISKSDYKWGMIGSLFSGLLFLPGSALAFVTILFVYAMLAQTKPVVRLN